jgi:hypothetical protein
MRKLDYATVSKLMAGFYGLSVGDLEARFRPAVVEDLDGVIKLRAEHTKIGKRKDDRAYLTWRYEFNEDKEWRNQLWVFEHQGEIIGTVGVERDFLTYRGETREVHKLMDILIHEDQMQSGLGVWITLRLQEFFRDTFCIGSTRYSHSIVTKLNNALPDLQTWRYPIRLQQVRGRRFPVLPLNALLKVRGLLRPNRVPPGYELVVSETADPRIRELHASMAEVCLIPSRNIDKWNWRFGTHPTLKTQFFGLIAHGQLVAHAAVTKNPARRADLYDLLFLHQESKRSSARTLSHLLALVINAMTVDGIDVISTRINDPISAEALSRAGFVYRDEPGPIGFRFEDESLRELMSQGLPLFLMPADADYD